jgi:hypothetical protein
MTCIPMVSKAIVPHGIPNVSQIQMKAASISYGTSGYRLARLSLHGDDQG